MEELVERLVLCGWRFDQAWLLAEAFIQINDYDGLKDLVRREECGLCM